jgi:hypothetical protein
MRVRGVLGGTGLRMTVSIDFTKTQLVCPRKATINAPHIKTAEDMLLTISTEDTHVFRLNPLSFSFTDGTVVAKEQMRVLLS